MRNLIFSLVFATICFAPPLHAASPQAKPNVKSTTAPKPNLENQVIIQLKDGPVVIELYPNKAPNHVARIKELAKRGFYNGVTFHRVIDGFMAQTGDPTGTGSGGSDLADLKAEFNDIKHVKGVVSMARTANVDGANSQFFIMLADSPHLDGQYTAFGRVISGMEFVDKIKKGDPYAGGKVENPDKIISMALAADATTSPSPIAKTNKK